MCVVVVKGDGEKAAPKKRVSDNANEDETATVRQPEVHLLVFLLLLFTLLFIVRVPQDHCPTRPKASCYSCLAPRTSKRPAQLSHESLCCPLMALATAQAHARERQRGGLVSSNRRDACVTFSRWRVQTPTTPAAVVPCGGVPLAPLLTEGTQKLLELLLAREAGSLSTTPTSCLASFTPECQQARHLTSHSRSTSHPTLATENTTLEGRFPLSGCDRERGTQCTYVHTPTHTTLTLLLPTHAHPPSSQERQQRLPTTSRATIKIFSTTDGVKHEAILRLCVLFPAAGRPG